MKNLYQSIKEEEEFELNKIKDYYKQGFVPMTLVDNADESDIETFVERRRENLLKLKPSKNENLFENEIILNQYFSSILSDKGELQVGDSIYRYTEKGLLITHISSRELLDDSLTYKTSANSKVKLYIPNKKRIPDFGVYPIDEGCEELLEANEFSMADESYGCGRGGGSRTIIPAPDTSNYNIFGKSYVCEYKFNSSFKLRTIFEASDFYFFQDVFKMSNAELIKLAYKSLRGKDVDLKKGQTGGVVILGQDPTSSNEVKPIFYSIFGEKIKVNRLAVAKRNFKTLSRMKLNELYFIFELDSSGSSTEFSKKYGFSIDLS